MRLPVQAADRCEQMKPWQGSEPSPDASNFDSRAERAFVDAVLSDDDMAKQELARRLGFVPKVVAMRNARMGRPLTEEELGDVQQDICHVVLRRLRDYQPIAPLESWVYRICCLTVQDAVRKKARSRRRSVALDDQPSADSEASLQRIADVAEIERALAGLGALESRVLRLKYLEGLTFVDLAARLEISPNTAKTLHYRGLEQLRRKLGVTAERREGA
jgi:RNA polymerase sigma factor (sigma-70 family)